jgi:hypothetical protein
MASYLSDPPPQLPCDDCMDAARCMLRGTLCRELICNWLKGLEVTGCSFQEPIEPSYHGIKGVRA